MSLIAALLIVTSAFMHAGWNFISQRRSPSLAFFFVTAVFAALTISPILIIHREVLGLVPTAVWTLVLATGIAQMVYFFGLAGAYQRGDISLAYPLARALPVLFVAAISLLWGNGGQIGPLGLLGMALITIGCIILPLRHWQQLSLHAYRDVVVLMALVAAIGTTGYTLIDDEALRQLRAALPLPNSQITLLFIALQTGSTAVMMGLATLLSPTERRQLRQIWHNRPLAAQQPANRCGHHGHLRAGAGGNGLREQRELRGRLSPAQHSHRGGAGADAAKRAALPAQAAGHWHCFRRLVLVGIG